MTAEERKNIGILYDAIIEEMKKHGLPKMTLLRNALTFAVKAHGDVRRRTGEPYVMHPLQVALILAEAGHDSEVIAAALLHDVMEDCGVTLEELEAEDMRYADLKAFKEGKVLFCNFASTPYRELSPVEPHILLADFVKAFHPEVLPHYQPKYYKIIHKHS